MRLYIVCSSGQPAMICHESFDRMFSSETLQTHLLQPAFCKVSRAPPQQTALNLLQFLAVLVHVHLIPGNAGRKPNQLCDCKILQVLTKRSSAPTNVEETSASSQGHFNASCPSGIVAGNFPFSPAAATCQSAPTQSTTCTIVE